jgi:UDP-N-acetylmuramate--alanine ligase
MPASLPPPPSHIHLVGIGGTGLSAIARVLLQKGHRVSGSDRALNALAEALVRDGATIYAGHDAANLAPDVDVVIVTSAVKDENPEITAALARGIPVYKRADIMASLMHGKKVIAVAGSHGKTTTTAMIVHILVVTGKHPSYIVGGTLKTTGTNAAWDEQGDVFVVEADEYDYMFLGLRPDIAVVTNVEWDHPDFFKTPEEFHHAFEQFVDLLPDDGELIACYDDPGAARLIDWQLNTLPYRHVQVYGVEQMTRTVMADNLRTNDKGIEFDIVNPYTDDAWTVQLSVTGKHNVANAMAALLATEYCCFHSNFTETAKAIESFTGTARRFELKGEVDGIAVIDDYAHNPTKIRVTIEAARGRYPDRELWAVWQPHTYSRTQTFMQRYLKAFDQADHVLVTDIYAAREQPIPGVTSAAFVTQLSHPDARHTPTLDNAVETLLREVKSPAVILIMSAGDATRIADTYLKVKG